MLSISTIISTSAFLRIKPEAFDAIFPHGPVLSQPLVQFITASHLRDIGTLVTDQKVKLSINAISKEMLTKSSEGLAGLWDTGNEIFKWKDQWKWPWPKWIETMSPHPEPWALGPQPQPWLESSVTQQIVLANVILSLTEVSVLEQYNNQLKEAASTMIRSAATNLVEDFSRRNIQSC